MSPFLALTLAALTVIASACSRADRAAPEIKTVIVHPDVPAFARQRCDDPSPLPDASLSAGQVTSAWARDRAALRQCEQKRAAAVAALAGK